MIESTFQTVKAVAERLSATKSLPITVNKNKYTKKVDGNPVGAFLGVLFENKRLMLVIGSKDEPVRAPMGIKDYTGWSSISVEVSEQLQQVLQAIDDAVLQGLAQNSKNIFGGNYTADQLLEFNFYTPLMYHKPDSDLSPIISGKVSEDVQIVDKDNAPFFIKGMNVLRDTCKDGAGVRVVFSIGSLYFKSINSCKLIVKAEAIQVLEKGQEDELKDIDFSKFD